MKAEHLESTQLTISEVKRLLRHLHEDSITDEEFDLLMPETLGVSKRTAMIYEALGRTTRQADAKNP